MPCLLDSLLLAPVLLLLLPLLLLPLRVQFKHEDHKAKVRDKIPEVAPSRGWCKYFHIDLFLGHGRQK